MQPKQFCSVLLVISLGDEMILKSGPLSPSVAMSIFDAMRSTLFLATRPLSLYLFAHMDSFLFFTGP
jgi:hypothetical protein